MANGTSSLPHWARAGPHPWQVHKIFGGRRALGSCSEALGPLGAEALRPALRAGRSAVLQIPPPGGGRGGQEHGDFAEGVPWSPCDYENFTEFLIEKIEFTEFLQVMAILVRKIYGIRF